MTQIMTEPDPTRSRPAAPAIPAGWYADPQGSAQRRWWNGSAWTHALEPLEPEAAAPAQSAAPWENLPGPSVRAPATTPSAYGAPARNAPTVLRALSADTEDSAPADGGVPETTASFPTRRQLREAEAEAARAAEFAASMGMSTGAVTTQRPADAAAVPSALETAAPATPPAAAQPLAERTPLPEQTPRDTAVFAMGAATPGAGQEAAAAQAAAAQPVPATPQHAPAQATPAEPATAPAADLVEPATTRPRPARPTVSADVAAALHFGTPAQPASDATLPAAAAGNAPGSGQMFGTAPSLGTAPTLGASSAPAATPAAGRSPLDVLGPISPSPATLSLSTRAYTTQVWLIVVLPVVVLGLAWALVILAPEQYTLSTQAGLVALMLLGSLGLALRDRRELAAAHHSRTASPLWALLTPLAYLVARALTTKQETGRGWAPVLVLLAVGAAIAAAAYFTPLALGPLLPF